MKWYVIEIEDTKHGSKPLKGAQHRLLMNEQWGLKPESRETEQIISAAHAKYPKASSKFTGRVFGNYKLPWLGTLDRAVSNYLKLDESARESIHIDIVAEIRI